MSEGERNHGLDFRQRRLEQEEPVYVAEPGLRDEMLSIMESRNRKSEAEHKLQSLSRASDSAQPPTRTQSSLRPSTELSFTSLSQNSLYILLFLNSPTSITGWVSGQPHTMEGRARAALMVWCPHKRESFSGAA